MIHKSSIWSMIIYYLSGSSRSMGSGEEGGPGAAARIMRSKAEARRESQAKTGVPTRTRPAGTIQSWRLERWNDCTHHASSAPPPAPAASRQQLMITTAVQDLPPLSPPPSPLVAAMSSCLERRDVVGSMENEWWESIDTNLERVTNTLAVDFCVRFGMRI